VVNSYESSLIMIHTRCMLWLSKRYQYPAEELPVDTETKVT